MVGDGGARRPPGSRNRWSAAARLIGRRDRVRLLALYVPVLVVDVLLDGVRALGLHSAAARRLSLTALPANLLVHLGVLGLWVLASTATPRGPWRRARIFLFHLSVTTYLVFTVATHLFFRRTGSLLDAATLAVFFSAPEVVADLVSRSSSPGQLVALALVVTYGALGPAVVHGVQARVARFRRARPTSSGPPHRRTQVGVGLTAVLALTAGLAAPLVTGSGAFARNNGVELALGAWDEARERAATDAVESPARTPSTLVRTTPAAGPQSAREPSNLVVVVLESLRWSATSLADPDLGTTPFLAELAGRSTVATRAYSAVPHTSKALTSVHCGITPPLDTRLLESEPGRIPATCLPELLRQEDYATAFFQSATAGFERRPDLARNLGFEEFRGVEDLPTEGFGPANYFGYEDDVLLEPSADWMRAQRTPFALTLLTVAGHHDYVLPDTFPLRHLDDDDELNRYLNTAAYQDRFVSKLFAQLDDLGVADDTVVALVGDHGEGFGEHGLRQHDNTIYDEGVHVPLLVYDPTDPSPSTVDVPVTTASTLPTVLDALGFAVAGADAVPAPLSEAEPAPLHLSCQSANRCLARIDGSTKFVHHFGHRPDELFDLTADPLEQDNLLATLGRQEVQRMRNELLDWRTSVRVMWAPAAGG